MSEENSAPQNQQKAAHFQAICQEIGITYPASLDLSNTEVLIPNRRSVQQFAEHLEVGPNVLDMGCGIGILTALAFKKGARRVTSVDVNQQALQETLKMAPTAKVLESDLFQWVEGRFDTILFNAPWGEGAVSNDLDRARYDQPGLMQRFFVGVADRLESDGEIWIQYGEARPGRLNGLLATATKHRFVTKESWSSKHRSYSTQRQSRLELHRMRYAG